MTYSIAYISRAYENITDKEIEELLHYSEARNTIVGIKGILLYK